MTFYKREDKYKCKKCNKSYMSKDPQRRRKAICVGCERLEDPGQKKLF